MNDAPFAPRPPARLARPILSPGEVARIRSERLEPRITQWDYLHLIGLRRGLASTLSTFATNAPILDLFCGTKPYVDLIPSRPVWGLDLDRHFRGADVVGGLPLPFADAAFGSVVCTQALHLVDDPIATVTEMARVLAEDGFAIVTVPHLFVAEGNLERHWSQRDLRHLFAGWRDVRMHGIDGPGVAFAFIVGRYAMRAAARWEAVKKLYAPLVVILNATCSLLDRLAHPLHRRWPHSMILVARRPATETHGIRDG